MCFAVLRQPAFRNWVSYNGGQKYTLKDHLCQMPTYERYIVCIQVTMTNHLHTCFLVVIHLSVCDCCPFLLHQILKLSNIETFKY
jgi:hypothetical protein